ncbi:MAG: PepSY domain-containing protein [Campylobacteraceae bacterium]|nr:PepSY domain-containing protein [Campylobacteraceae bacterium]
MLRIFKKSWWFNIHMILGLLLGITIMIVGITGALLSYRPEIMAVINSESLHVKKSVDAPLSLAELVEKVSKQSSNISISSLTVYSDETRSVSVGTISGRGRGAFFVNPYTGEMLPSIKGGEFFAAVISLHRWMTFQGMNATGKQVVAISTVAIIILSISGLWLYMPPMRRNFLKSMAINFKKGWFALLYKLHIVIGVYTLIFVLIMCLTGLYWSYGWYRTMLYKIAGVEQPVRTHNMQRQQPKVESVNDLSYLDKIYTVFKDNIGEDYTSLTLNTVAQEGTYSISYQDTKGDMNRVQADIEKNEIVSNSKFENRTLGEKFMSSIYPLHSGYFFGEIGKFLWCISSAAMALFMLSGFVMFYKRIKARYRLGK